MTMIPYNYISIKKINKLYLQRKNINKPEYLPCLPRQRRQKLATTLRLQTQVQVVVSNKFLVSPRSIHREVV